MLKPEQLSEMTGEERTRMFETLAIAYYGTNSYVPMAARDLDVARRTIFDWKKRQDVPAMALATMDAWAHGNLQERVVADYHELAQHMADACESLRLASGAFTRIVKRLPVLTDDAASDEGAHQGDDVSPQ